MGNSFNLQYLHTHIEQFKPSLQNYQLLSEYHDVIQIPSNIYSLGIKRQLLNLKVNQKLIQYEYHATNRQQYESILENFLYRYSHQNNMKYSIDIPKQNKQNQQFLISAKYIIVNLSAESNISVRIFYQNSLTTLNNFKQIPQNDCAYLFMQLLKGFNKLVQKFGAFIIKEQMIHLTQNRKVKVWLSHSIQQIAYPQNPLHKNQQYLMVQKIIQIIQKNVYFGKWYQQSLIQTNNKQNQSILTLQMINQFKIQKSLTLKDAIQKLQKIFVKNRINISSHYMKCLQDLQYYELLQIVQLIKNKSFSGRFNSNHTQQWFYNRSKSKTFRKSGGLLLTNYKCQKSCQRNLKTHEGFLNRNISTFQFINKNSQSIMLGGKRNSSYILYSPKKNDNKQQFARINFYYQPKVNQSQKSQQQIEQKFHRNSNLTLIKRKSLLPRPSLPEIKNNSKTQQNQLTSTNKSKVKGIRVSINKIEQKQLQGFTDLIGYLPIKTNNEVNINRSIQKSDNNKHSRKISNLPVIYSSELQNNTKSIINIQINNKINRQIPHYRSLQKTQIFHNKNPPNKGINMFENHSKKRISFDYISKYQTNNQKSTQFVPKKNQNRRLSPMVFNYLQNVSISESLQVNNLDQQRKNRFCSPKNNVNSPSPIKYKMKDFKTISQFVNSPYQISRLTQNQNNSFLPVNLNLKQNQNKQTHIINIHSPELNISDHKLYENEHYKENDMFSKRYNEQSIVTQYKKHFQNTNRSNRGITGRQNLKIVELEQSSIKSVQNLINNQRRQVRLLSELPTNLSLALSPNADKFKKQQNNSSLKQSIIQQKSESQNSLKSNIKILTHQQTRTNSISPESKLFLKQTYLNIKKPKINPILFEDLDRIRKSRVY